MQRANLVRGVDRLLRRLGRVSRVGAIDRDKGLQSRFQPVDAREAIVWQLHRRQVAACERGEEFVRGQVGRLHDGRFRLGRGTVMEGVSDGKVVSLDEYTWWAN